MKVGIDLGTTNSAIAYIDEYGTPQIISNREGNRTTQSVVLFDEGTPIVGEVAKDESIINPENTIQFIKRYIGKKNGRYMLNGKAITPEGISALILKKLINDAQEYLGEEITEAVVTVPADFNDNERKATIDACKICGIKLNKIIHEATAAALAYGLNKNAIDQNIVVYDLGGGTFDATVMELKDGNITIKSSLGDKHLGGVDFENQIIKHVMYVFEQEFNKKLYTDRKAMQDLRQKVEKCKKTLSTRNHCKISITGRGHTLDIEITQDQFHHMISGMINKTIKIMNRAVIDAKLTWNDIDKILLVGGSTRIKMVSDQIEKLIGIKPSREINPDEAVAIGAAIQANIDNIAKPMKISDVCARSLGIVWYDKKNNRELNKIIINKNTTIPCKQNIVFRTVIDNQKQYTLKLSEGDSNEVDKVDIIATAKINLKPRPKGSPINISISYDENSIIDVKVIDKMDNSLLDEIKIDRTGNMDDLEIKDNMEQLSLVNFSY